MNPGEHELQYPWVDVPTHGAWQTLRPGVHWVRLRFGSETRTVRAVTLE